MFVKTGADITLETLEERLLLQTLFGLIQNGFDLSWFNNHGS